MPLILRYKHHHMAMQAAVAQDWSSVSDFAAELLGVAVGRLSLYVGENLITAQTPLPQDGEVSISIGSIVYASTEYHRVMSRARLYSRRNPITDSSGEPLAKKAKYTRKKQTHDIMVKVQSETSGVHQHLQSMEQQLSNIQSLIGRPTGTETAAAAAADPEQSAIGTVTADAEVAVQSATETPVAEVAVQSATGTATAGAEVAVQIATEIPVAAPTIATETPGPAEVIATETPAPAEAIATETPGPAEATETAVAACPVENAEAPVPAEAIATETTVAASPVESAATVDGDNGDSSDQDTEGDKSDNESSDQSDDAGRSSGQSSSDKGDNGEGIIGNIGTSSDDDTAPNEKPVLPQPHPCMDNSAASPDNAEDAIQAVHIKSFWEIYYGSSGVENYYLRDSKRSPGLQWPPTSALKQVNGEWVEADPLSSMCPSFFDQQSALIRSKMYYKVYGELRQVQRDLGIAKATADIKDARISALEHRIEQTELMIENRVCDAVEGRITARQQAETTQA